MDKAGAASRALAGLFLAAAIALAAVNVAGWFIPLGNPRICQDPRTLFKDDCALTLGEARERLRRRPGESGEETARRFTDAVSRAVAHFWAEDPDDPRRLAAPLTENYLLYLKSYTDPDHYRHYEFRDPDKGLARGFGLCSQHVLILQGYLREAGVPSRIAVLGGHVVLAAAAAPGREIVCDPDFGVVIPLDLATIVARPELVKTYYQDVPARLRDPERDRDINADLMARVYGPEGNHILDGPINYLGPERYYFERASYVLIWVIPILLALPALAVLIQSRKVKGNETSG